MATESLMKFWLLSGRLFLAQEEHILTWWEQNQAAWLPGGRMAGCLLSGQYFWKRLVSASSSSCFLVPPFSPYTLQASFSMGTVSLPSVPLLTWTFSSSSDKSNLGLLLPEPPSSGGKGQEGVIGNATSEQHPSYTAQGPHKIWATVSHFP